MAKVGRPNDNEVTEKNVQILSASWLFKLIGYRHYSPFATEARRVAKGSTFSAVDFECEIHMKATTWSAATLIGFAALSTTHCNIARALTYEETACVSQAYMEGWDPTRCFGTGGTGGGAGSGGSGGVAGTGADDGSGFGGLGYYRKNCPTPSFFFTGPPDPSTVSTYVEVWQAGGSEISETTTKFIDVSSGERKQYERMVREVVGFGSSHPELKSLFTVWSTNVIDSSGNVGGADQIKSCDEVPHDP